MSPFWCGVGWGMAGGLSIGFAFVYSLGRTIEKAFAMPAPPPSPAPAPDEGKR
jgi:hypothetical protein